MCMNFTPQNLYTLNTSYTENAEDIADIIDIDSIISLALQNEYAIGVRGFEHDGSIVIAVLTTPFYLKSERDNARNMIENELCELTNNDSIIVTFDVQVYRNIRGNMSESDRSRVLKLAKERR